MESGTTAFRAGGEHVQKCHHRFRAGDGIMRYKGKRRKRNIARNEVAEVVDSKAVCATG